MNCPSLSSRSTDNIIGRGSSGSDCSGSSSNSDTATAISCCGDSSSVEHEAAITRTTADLSLSLALSIFFPITTSSLVGILLKGRRGVVSVVSR